MFRSSGSFHGQSYGKPSEFGCFAGTEKAPCPASQDDHAPGELQVRSSVGSALMLALVAGCPAVHGARICSDPVQVHVVATVRKVMTRGGVVNVYGDFTALQAHGVVPKNCMIWVLQVQDSSFSERKEIYELLHETLYDSEGRPAPPDVFTAKSTVYVAFLANIQRQHFQLNSFNRFPDTLLDLLGVPRSTMPLASLWSHWQPDRPLVLDRVSPLLTCEQLAVLQQILTTPDRRLFTISAGAGSGKSYLVGAFLRMWLDATGNTSDPSVAVVTTGRAARRKNLLLNLGVLVPKDQCFILESGMDFDNEAALGDAFWHAGGAGKGQRVSQEASLRP